MVTFFENIPSGYRTAILVGGLLLLWIIEGLVPRFRFSSNRYRHAGTNLFFTLTTVIINTGLAFLIVKASLWTSAKQFGLLYWLQLPLWLHTVMALLMLDFIGAWLIHWVQHKTAWMWHFHKIHHIDTQIDATTALRHHPVESLFRVIALFVAIITMGVPFWMVMFYQTISAFMSQFNHANIRLPQWLDNTLSWVIVSPDMHKVHHSHFQPETDANYANIFSIWDRLFGTFVKVADTRNIKYGLDQYQDTRYQEIGPLLKVPWEQNYSASEKLSGQHNNL
ncbi:sterol desaturase/sphingolipid hydroxylase (fatty acid hydroxylase superfamily) [Chitinophaga niastensis]|uniref:Sterol desaturase/sphingolipid hydroxylase (Fatty acid hydroxylase superfamily) n=1 Tax=Chitinophaga niastensis TaxID=536980 RepID=A0A2P8HTA4_CHINA|nr:sterol desaturase family protein [Chitinophaga niastensis]PSL49425.1 sterol desaturase/sphingolipid hydroxylase (fatty acid hydroxylase superfamily) [Chitinophaga niastensis]